MITDLGVAGFGFPLDKLKILEDDIDVETNQQWYYILQKATNKGFSSHLVMSYEDTLDGQSEWYAMKDWYEGKLYQATSQRQQEQNLIS